MCSSRNIRNRSRNTDGYYQNERSSHLQHSSHQLQDSWTLWFHQRDRSRSWADNLRALVNFSTIEEFWDMLNIVLPASQLLDGSDYCVFKEGIVPMWEDKANHRGGRWIMKLPSAHRAYMLDTIWEETLLAMLDDLFTNSPDVCGAVLNVRRGFDKISIWVKDYKNKPSVEAIGWNLRECLCLDSNTELMFEHHVDLMMKSTDKSMEYTNKIKKSTDNKTIKSGDNSTMKSTDNNKIESTDNSAMKCTGNTRVESADNTKMKSSNTDNTTMKSTDNTTIKSTENTMMESTDNAMMKSIDNQK